MPVELNIVESVTELDTTVVTVVLESASEPGPAGPGVPAGGTAGQVLTKDSGTDYDTSWQDSTGGPGAVDAEDVGFTPAGTISATDVQAAVEEVASDAAGALSTHEADTTNVHGITDTAALALSADVPSNSTFNDHSARHENGGADEINIGGLDGVPTALTTHEADTTSVHGIADTSALLDTSDIGVSVQAFDADLSTYAGITPSANVQSLLGAANYAAMRTLLSLVVGTNVQAWDADLDTYAGITPSANVQSLLAAANYAAMRALLDLEAGTDFPSLTTFNDHSARHEDGGSDEIDLTGLSGTPAALTTHEADTTSVHGITDTSTLYRSGGTDVALADGGTGASLTDPNADRVLFWDDSAGAVTWLTVGTNLTITGTTLDASGSGGGDADLTPAFAFGGY